MDKQQSRQRKIKQILRLIQEQHMQQHKWLVRQIVIWTSVGTAFGVLLGCLLFS